VVVPGSQGLGNDLVERNRGRLTAINGPDATLEAFPLALDDLQPLTPVFQVEAADGQTRHRMYRPPGESGLVQRMLDDGTAETRERVTIEVRRLTIHLADSKQHVVRLVLEHPLLTAVEPGDVRTANPCPRRDRDQASIRQSDLGERVAVVQADTGGIRGLAIGHTCLRW
jgi:hypothetical protein